MSYCGGFANLWFISTDNCVLVFKTLRLWFIRISDRGKVLLDIVLSFANNWTFRNYTLLGPENHDLQD